MNFSCVVDLDRENITPYEWNTESQNTTAENGYGCATSAFVLLLFGTPLNAFVAGTIIFKKLYQSVAVIPMLNLAVTNLLVCLFILPFVIISGYSTEFIFGSSDYVRCKVCSLGIANVALPFVSIYTIALMSVGRLLYLKKPIQYHSIVTPVKIVAILAAIWTSGIIVSLPPLFGFGSVRFALVIATCAPLVVGSSHIFPNWYYCLMIALVGSFAVVVVFVMYIWIVCIARQHIIKNPRRFALLHKQSATELHSLKNIPDSVKEQERIVRHANKLQQFRMIQVLGAMVVANVITWIPMLALALTGAVVGSSVIPASYFAFTYTCYLSQIIFHPLLQIMLIYEVKETIMNIWTSFKKAFCKVCNRTSS